MMAKRDTTDKLDALLGSISADLLGVEPQQLASKGIRVERLLLDLVRPDPLQPRRVLPERVHQPFHQGRLSPVQALRELVQMAQITARQRGCPFNSPLDLLPDADTEDEVDSSGAYSPEERLLSDLLTLAITLRDDGQVNPLTVVDVSQGATQLFRIETGERRYWATWLLKEFIPGYRGDGTLPCIIVPGAHSSVFRQARENTARAGLTAVALARQSALLLLTVHGYEIPAYAVGNDFYRQALDLDLRTKQEYSADILAAMGGISRMHFSRYKSLLYLSDEAMELADRYAIEEGKLRHLVAMPSEYHVEVIHQIIDLNLTSRQVEELCAASGDEHASLESVQDKLSRPARQLARLSRSSNESFGLELARALLQQERSSEVARARIASLRKLLDEAEQHLLSQG
jgi:hypothetical protein